MVASTPCFCRNKPRCNPAMPDPTIPMLFMISSLVAVWVTPARLIVRNARFEKRQRVRPFENPDGGQGRRPILRVEERQRPEGYENFWPPTEVFRQESPARLHIQHPRQESPTVRNLFDDLRRGFARAVPGFGLDADQRGRGA